jgi:peptidyl-prolyl cis-trans isomerase D
MIVKMRQIAPVFIFIASAAFVATIFFDWGMDVTGFGQRAMAGTIEGRRIAMDMFDKMVNRERQRLQESTEGGEVPAEQYRMVPRQVWERMVSEQVLGRTFKQMNLGASADEIYAYMRRNPPPGLDTMKQFKTNGVFDTTKYEQLLNNPAIWDNYGWHEMEQRVRDMVVPMQKLETLLKMSLVPSRLEAGYEYRQRFQRGVFEYAYVGSAGVRLDSGAVSDQMVQSYYASHSDSFACKEEVDLRFVSLPKLATVSDEKLYQEELAELKTRILAGEAKFDEEAQSASDDAGTAKQGGELGWFGAGAMTPEFEKVAFSLQPGQISDPVRTQFGYHLIKVEEKRTVNGKPEVRARHILRKITASIETLDSLKARLDSLLDACDTGDFVQVGRRLAGATVDSTGLFPKGGEMPKAGYLGGVAGWAFGGSSVGDVSENVYENQDAFYAFQVRRKLKAGKLPLDDARERIVAKLTEEKRAQEARHVLDAALAKAGSGSVAGLSTTDSSITSGVSDTVSAASYVPPVGFANQALATAFSLPIGTVSSPVEVPGGVCVVKPLWRSTLDSIPWESPALAEIKRTAAQVAAQKVYVDWYMTAKRAARVKSNIEQFYVD